MPGAPHRISNAQRAAVCGLVLAGIPYRQACAVLALGPRTLLAGYLGKDWAAPRGVKRGRYRWYGERLEGLRRALADPTIPIRTICKQFHIHCTYLHELQRIHGWPSVRLSGRKAAIDSEVRMSPERRKLFHALRTVMPWQEAKKAAWAHDFNSGAHPPPSTAVRPVAASAPADPLSLPSETIHPVEKLRGIK